MDLNAQHVKDVQAASNAADLSKIARLGEGRQLMQGADTALNQRINTGYTGSNAVDDIGFKRAAGLQSLYSGMSTEKQNQFKTAGDMAQNAQADALARVTGGQASANQSQNSAMTRILNGSNASHLAQGDTFDRLASGMTAAGQMTTAERQRLFDAVNLSKGKDDQERQRILDGQNLANLSSLDKRSGLVSGFNAADRTQGLTRERLRDTFVDSSALGGAQANTSLTGTNAANDEKTKLFSDQINLILKGGGVESEKQAALSKLVAESAKLGVSIASLGLKAETDGTGKTTYKPTKETDGVIRESS
jgi:hypothetical protein